MGLGKTLSHEKKIPYSVKTGPLLYLPENRIRLQGDLIDLNDFYNAH